MVTANDAKHAPLSDQFLAIRGRHRLARFRRHVRDLWLIGAAAAHCAADMRHAPDTLLIGNEHKAVPVGEAVRCLEVVSIALDEIRLAAPYTYRAAA